MIYSEFKGKQLSLLGFGAMRLPVDAQGVIDEKQLEEMIRCAIEGGVNYFDTAWPYHGGKSEAALARALRAYPRKSYYLADKYPGHQISATYDPAAIFEKQLERCGVDYFDFYLLHNVNENSIENYLDERWGMLEYFKEQKRLGRIHHLGFSCHGGLENLEAFLDYCGEDMEFCQIQLNFLDWTLQQAKEKVELLSSRGIPVWVMEPVRGGKLCNLGEDDSRRLEKMRPEDSVASWGFRFVQDVPGVQMILSGMSTLAQVQDNLKTFENRDPLTDAQRNVLFDIADKMKDSVPCTACRYCTPHCPMGLDIPLLLSVYNDLRFESTMGVAVRVERFASDKQPAACIGCGACAAICPQRIDIPGAMQDMAKKLESVPKWAEVCRQREEAARKAAQQGG